MFPDLLPTETSTVVAVPAPRTTTPALFAPTVHAERRFWEFFTAHIRNPNTRLAYPRPGGAGRSPSHPRDHAPPAPRHSTKVVCNSKIGNSTESTITSTTLPTTIIMTGSSSVERR